jgi:hypothetical protein
VEGGGGEEKFLTGNQNDRHHGVQTSSLNFPNNNNNNPKKKYSERGEGKLKFSNSFSPFSSLCLGRLPTVYCVSLIVVGVEYEDETRLFTLPNTHTHQDPSPAVTGPDVKYYIHKNTHRETGSGRF